MTENGALLCADDGDEALYRQAHLLRTVAGEETSRVSLIPFYRAPEIGSGGLRLRIAQDDAQNIVWKSLFQLPGYGSLGEDSEASAGNRERGRSIFRSLPCFRRMETECRAGSRDPLGEVQLMETGDGLPRHQKNPLTAWIKKNGQVLEWGKMLPLADIPGYAPLIMLALSGNESFLLIRDSGEMEQTDGVDLIYSWLGGRTAYDNDPLARPSLMRLRPNVPVATPAPEIEEQGVAPAEIGPTRKLRASRREKKDPVLLTDIPKREAILDRSAIAGVRLNSMQYFRQAGFTSLGTADGPALQKTLDDGRIALVLGEGRSLALATRFTVRIYEAANHGDPLEEDVVDGHEAAVDWAECRNAPGMSR